MNNIKLAPSLLAADFMNMGPQIKLLEQENAEMLHFDVMDGKFVPEVSFGEPLMRSLKKGSSIPLDVHLMIEEPLINIESFAKNGADSITFHVEAAKDVKRVIERIHSFGVKAALSLKPDTPVERLFPYLDELDMILVMTVYPGFGGQKFMPESVERIAAIRKELERRGLNTDIQVDGGINRSTIRTAMEAGANVFVAGSGIFNGDIAENVRALRALCS